MKQAIKKSYGSKGEEIVKMNNAAVDAGIDAVTEVKVPAAWADAKDAATERSNVPAFIRDVVEPINAQKGDDLPVSAFVGREDGTFPQGTSQYEKRGIALEIPVWKPENCIQCNQCSFVCPHAVIRPFLLTEEEAANAPEGMVTRKGMRPYDSFQYRIQVSALDCTGCGPASRPAPPRKRRSRCSLWPITWSSPTTGTMSSRCLRSPTR